ncbi:MAG: hypothetical protein JW800_05360, partial [Candidatus Omnitrophica bacterium]|nr:hypothetical protein [Candidatus Omnitrophota bacterium]
VKDRDKVIPIFFSALFAVLSVWSKQTFVFLFLSLPLYVFVAYGSLSFKRYLAAVIIAALIISSAFILCFGYKNLLLNLLIIPAHHPLIGFNRTYMPPLICIDLLVETLFLLAMLSVVIFYSSRGLSNYAVGIRGIKEWLDENRWLIFVFTGLCMMPVSIIANLKIGATYNSLSYMIYFIAAGVSLAIAQHAAALNRNLIRRGLIILMAVLICLASPKLWRAVKVKDTLTKNNEKVAYDYAIKHPDQIYLPANPLAGIMADGRLYHSLSGIREREWAGFQIDRECFMSNVPQDMRQVAFPKYAFLEDAREYMEAYLKEFSNETQIGELSGWIVYEK